MLGPTTVYDFNLFISCFAVATSLHQFAAQKNANSGPSMKIHSAWQLIIQVYVHTEYGILYGHSLPIIQPVIVWIQSMSHMNDGRPDQWKQLCVQDYAIFTKD